MKFIIALIFLSFQLAAIEPITGYWKAFDGGDEPRSVVGIYEKDGKYYGRILFRYDENGGLPTDTLKTPLKKTEGIEGQPYYVGLDVIYNLEPKDEKYVGKVIDPEKGRVYDAVLWREGANLIMRGEMKLMGQGIGRNNTWLPAADADFPKHFPKPDLRSFVPQIPEPLKKK